MNYSIGVEHALHSLFYMIDLKQTQTIGIKALSNLHGVSESYLSKIFTKLKKGGIVISMPGVNGGYKLSKKAIDITFWDIIEAIEGSSYIFQCKETRKQNILNTKEDEKSYICDCIIKTVMIEAENKMRDELKEKTLEWLYKNTYSKFSKEKKKNIKIWLDNNTNN